jgi:DNA ligase-associated metallophosphoesterase
LLPYTFWITPQRCCWWEEENALILSDLHLGKSGHFRKEGISVPQGIYRADLQRLIAQLFYFKADRLIIVGDFTHSKANRELDHFLKWRNDFPSLEIDLVKGNHDILADSWYRDAGITVFDENLLVGDFCFRHDLDSKGCNDVPAHTAYTFVGHVHPGITVRGKGRQALHFPCFYFAKTHCILPAFSRFTGTFSVEQKKNETVYAIADDQLLRI